VFEVFENVSEQEVAELEGLVRHLYRKDSRANNLNVQKSFAPFKRIRVNNLSAWARQRKGGS
jgi:hypothetical protein